MRTLLAWACATPLVAAALVMGCGDTKNDDDDDATGGGTGSGTLLSDPCGDIKACCVAQSEIVAGADPSACDIYDNADEDACQAAIDAYEPVAGADVPEECAKL